MRFGILYFTCFLAFISQPTYAIKVTGLYQAVVSVSDESTQKRRMALKQALGKVLVKLQATGILIKAWALLRY